MIRKTFASLLIALVLNLVCPASFAANTQTKDEKRAATVKSLVRKLGTGPDARIGIKLRDKTKLVGYISEIANDHFALTDNAGTVRQVTYADVAKINAVPTSTSLLKKDIHSGHIFKKIAIAFGVIAAISVLVCVASKGCD